MDNYVWKVSSISQNTAWVNFSQYIWELVEAGKFDFFDSSSRSAYSSGFDHILDRDFTGAYFDSYHHGIVFPNEAVYTRFILTWG